MNENLQKKPKQLLTRVAVSLRSFLFFGLVLLTPVPLAAQTESKAEPTITFAQITDAHIFDDGWNQNTADAMRQAAEDRKAFHWSIEKINQLVSAGTKIDFVVYTGDLGLQNVEFPSGGSCNPLPAQIEPGLPPFTLRWAVNEVANEINQLAVRKVFFLPGNNDLIGEAVTDSRRFDCFFNDLQKQVQSLNQPLQIAKLEADSIVDVAGIRLAGLNTASFKKLLNYERSCSGKPNATDAAMLREACPESQMLLLRQFNAAGPLVLFTHVPDLKDPFRKTGAWEIKPAVRQLWEQQVCQSAIVAVFAGHFHDSNQALYATTTGTSDLVVTKCVADKTWVAPPLAVKNQVDKNPQARGFLLATVGRTAVLHAQPIWFDQEIPATSPNPSYSYWLPAMVMIFAISVIGLAVLGWFNLTNKYRDLTGLLVALLFFGICLGAIWLAKHKLAIADNATLIALLVLPLILYGIASGRLTEFTGPGGWGAKFRAAAQQPVDLSLTRVDVIKPQAIEKESVGALKEKILRGEIREGQPIILTMVLGNKSYNPDTLGLYLRELGQFTDFKFVVFLDPNGSLVSYFPHGLLERMFSSQMPAAARLMEACINGDAKTLEQFPGALTGTVTGQTTNADALREMERLGVDALLVTDEKTGKITGIIDRGRILSHMLLALAEAGKA